MIATFKTIDVRRPDQFPAPINDPGLKSKPRDLWLCLAHDRPLRAISCRSGLVERCEVSSGAQYGAMTFCTA